MFTIDELRKATQGRIFNYNPIAVSGITTDTRALKKGEAFLAIKGDNFDGHEYLHRAVTLGASMLIVSEDFWKKGYISDTHKNDVPVLIVKNTVRAYGDIAHYHRMKFDVIVVGITGSSGKTTTKEMTGHILGSKFKVLCTEGNKNNLIGVPQTLLRLDRGHQVCVLEMGTNQFGEISRIADIARPTIGVITNIGESHLEYLKNKKNVFKEKMGMFKFMRRAGYAVLNKDDEFLSSAKPQCRAVTYGMNGSAKLKAHDVETRYGMIKFKVGKNTFLIRGIGTHNVMNALSAIAVCEIAGMTRNSIRHALTQYESPLKNRMAVYRTKSLCIIDDSYNSNPVSFKASVRALAMLESKGRKIIITGDMFELGKSSRRLHEEAGYFAAKAGLDMLVACGKYSRFTAQACKKAGMKPNNVRYFVSPEKLGGVLEAIVSKGDTVLVKGSRGMRMENIVAKLKEI